MLVLAVPEMLEEDEVGNVLYWLGGALASIKGASSLPFPRFESGRVRPALAGMLRFCTGLRSSDHEKGGIIACSYLHAS